MDVLCLIADGNTNAQIARRLGISEGTVRNAVNGIDPMRAGRIKVICKVLAKYGDGVSYERLVNA